MRMLVCVINYGSKNDGYCAQVLASYLAMPWQPRVVVCADRPKSYGPQVEVRVLEAPAGDGLQFMLHGRRLLAEQAGRYDLYVLAEDDVLIATDHVSTWRTAAQALGPRDVPALFRIERPGSRTTLLDQHRSFGWDVATAQMLNDRAVCQFTNLHTAVHLLDAGHLQTALASGKFTHMVKPWRHYNTIEAGSAWLYSPDGCGLRRWGMLDSFESLWVHHLPDTYAGQLGFPLQLALAQVGYLRQVAAGQRAAACLAPAMTRLWTARWDLNGDNPRREDLLARLRPVQRVLWVGSLDGQTELSLVERGVAVTAIALDVAYEASLRACGLLVLPADLELACNELSRAGSQFDAIVIPELLSRMHDPVLALRKLKPLLAPGGQVLVSEPNFAQWQAFALACGLRCGCRPLAERIDFHRDGIHPLTQRLLTRWFNAAGLRARCSLPVGQGWRRWLAAPLLRAQLADRIYCST
jgi:SAM-dependent methyltransferase